MAFCPPNPNEFDSASLTGAGRRLVTCSMSHSGSSSVRLIVGRSSPRSMAQNVATASTAPAAPRRCPIEPFELETGGREPLKTERMAWASTRSFIGVEVPWALM